jgi:hypothetical protein
MDSAGCTRVKAASTVIANFVMFLILVANDTFKSRCHVLRERRNVMCVSRYSRYLNVMIALMSLAPPRLVMP